MGWLIVSLVLMAIFAIVVYFTDTKWSSTTCWELFGSMGAMISLAVAATLTIFLITAKADEEAFIEKYNNKVELIQSVVTPSDEVIEEVFNTNGYILNEKVKSAKFMTKGLYSKKVGALPLLEIPKAWYVDSD